MTLKPILFAQPQFSKFQLAYFGGDADEHRLDMYDASASYYGFARTLSILGHFYSTGEINAHAPKSELKVFLETAEEGSFKQTILAAAVGAVVATPLTVFITRAIDGWIPTEDAQTNQVIDLLKEQNRILSGGKAVPTASQTEVENADRFLEEQKEKVDVIRSITANSFKGIFRPVDRSVEVVGITHGQHNAPIGAVNKRALQLIEADRPDPDVVSIMSVVSSFSRGSKTGVVFSKDIGRGFRIEYTKPGKLPYEDDFSWSQYYQRPIRLNGRFIKFFDGKVKKLLVYEVSRPTEAEIQEYFKQVLID